VGKLDWHHWFERWEAMQNCYVPQRVYRFDLMLSLVNLPREDKVRILDLGCGPGSLTFRALWHYSNAHVVAVDFDPVMLAMGRNVVNEEANRVQFVLADIRQADWWEPYEGMFDLVMSATTLHWLSAEHLAQVYQRIYQVLKPSGWFLNSDHVASDDPEMQTRYRQMLQVRQQAAFGATGADNWDGFWQSLRRELEQPDVHETELWEGTDDGLPRQFHIEALQACGFEQVAVHWQDLGEAVVSARKMSGQYRRGAIVWRGDE
jgi:ubiquinone/menaquinone biosynthesis C-methylase UbiE